jgi:hypothetical protein
MVFPDGDGPFGSVLLVVVRGDQLKLDVFGTHELFESSGAFVVEFLKAGFESAVSEVGVELAVSPDQFLLCSGLHGLGEDGTRIVIVEYHYIFVSFAGDNGEATCLIGEDFAGRVNDLSIHKISLDLGFQRRGQGCHDR